jgi:DNA-binding CsgD family transcriptional regulator
MDKKVFAHILRTLGVRDLEIVQLLANDLRPKEIAEQLNTSIRSIEGRVLAIRKAFACNSVAGLVALFFRNKIIK